MKRHGAARKGVYEGSHFIDCACGERGVLWATELGAALAFVRHVASDAAAEVLTGVTVAVTVA